MYSVNRCHNRRVLREIWNEPDLETFWGGDPDAAEYAKLLAGAYNRIKSIDSSIVVLSAGFSRRATNSYLDEFYSCTDGQEPIKNCFDVMSFHSYDSSIGSSSALSTRLDSLRSIMTTYLDHNKRVWVTGFGVRSTDDAASEEAQSEYYDAAMITFLQEKYIRGVYPHVLSNADGDTCGLLKSGGEENKPACYLYKSYSNPE